MVAKRTKSGKVEEKHKEEKKVEKKKNTFNLIEVIIIMIITSICSITLTIKVSYTLNNTAKKIKTEAELSELINVYNSINDEYYEQVDKKALINSAISGMLGNLNDPYTVLLSETESENLNKELEGEYVGLGAEIKSFTDGTFLINKVYSGSPAEKAGLKEKDKLLVISGTDLSGKKIDDLSKLLKVTSGTEIEIVVERNNEKITVKATIGKVELPSVQYEIIEGKNGKASYIKISTFAKNTLTQFKNALEKSEVKNTGIIILDLRGNTGGHLTVAESIAGMFLKKNDVIYQLKNKNDSKKVTNSKDGTIKAKVVVLADSQTASASEILIAALKDNLNIDVVGTKTFGKGKVQKVKELPSGSTIKYTVQSWLTPKGEEIDGNGILPTVEVEQSQEYKTNPSFDNDLQYKKALDILKIN